MQNSRHPRCSALLTPWSPRIGMGLINEMATWK
jgi:hypothetical protein